MTISRSFNSFLDFCWISLEDFNLAPESYLGPNWQAVLDGWLFIESLDERQKNIVSKRFYDWNSYEQNDRIVFLIDKTKDVIGEGNQNSVFQYSSFPIGAIYELIAMHNLIEENYPFHYLKLLEDL